MKLWAKDNVATHEMAEQFTQAEAAAIFYTDERYRYLFTVEAVNEQVKQGVSFREAYKSVGNQIEAGNFKWDTSKSLHHTHEGSMGNLFTSEVRAEMRHLLELGVMGHGLHGF